MLTEIETKNFFLGFKKNYLEYVEMCLKKFKKDKNPVHKEHIKSIVETYKLIKKLYGNNR